ncbi:MAG: ribose 5-phosphate isomerase B [Bacteroidota bacterium]|jgi:ribose 5-phosphate isomerase B|nr:ribose 5-phosphate isomerase B [Bacteroidota bacterium]
MKVALGGDHAGFKYKSRIVAMLENEGIQIQDFGPFTDDSVDYPDFAHPLSEAVEKGNFNFGILICGSGNGVAIAANKHQKIRAALCWNEELAALARKHNNANILCLAARFTDFSDCTQIIKTFLNTQFEGGRHSTRVNKISC